jgi:hypothetical protein
VHEAFGDYLATVKHCKATNGAEVGDQYRMDPAYVRVSSIGDNQGQFFVHIEQNK